MTIVIVTVMQAASWQFCSVSCEFKLHLTKRSGFGVFKADVIFAKKSFVPRAIILSLLFSTESRAMSANCSLRVRKNERERERVMTNLGLGSNMEENKVS